MIDERVERAADALAAAWRTRRRIALPSAAVNPRDLDDAELIQDALDRRLNLTCIGWKLGLTSRGGQAATGFDRPFMGRLYRQCVVGSPARFSADRFAQPLVEAEFGYRLARDLPPRAAPYSESDVLGSVGQAFIGVEVADTRYAQRWPISIPYLAADNGATGAYIVGPDVPDWQGRNLSGIDVTLAFNGRHVADSLSGDARADPIQVLLWGARKLARRGIGLKAGDIVTTGAACSPTEGGPGTEVVASFEGLGEIHITIEG